MNNPSLAQLAEATSLNLVKSEFESLKRDHPFYNIESGYTLYGPYSRSDNRLHVIAWDGKTNKTISYPKFIMECKFKKLLNKDEEVHHIDGLEFNNKINNFEIRNATLHRKDQQKVYEEMFICPVCGNLIHLSPYQVSRRKTEMKRGKGLTGPYCSKRCIGKVHYQHKK